MLPYKDFCLLTKEEASPQFRFLAERLKKADVDFFLDKAKNERKSFLFEVILSYNFQDSLQSSIDLGCFPYFKKVSNSELTRDQQDQLAGSKRNCSREPAKLVSTHENGRIVVDFVDNLIYLLTFHSCYVVEVLSVTSFTTAPFLAEYIQSLQIARSRATSPLQGRLIKNLSNRYLRRIKIIAFLYILVFELLNMVYFLKIYRSAFRESFIKGSIDIIIAISRLPKTNCYDSQIVAILSITSFSLRPLAWSYATE